MTKNINKNKGFSLIELMVAIGIFTSIVTVLLGALIVTINASKNSKALRVAMDNVNFSMESMTRSIRMGTNYYCSEKGDILNMDGNNKESNDCDDGDFVSFIPTGPSSNNYRVGYGLVEQDGKMVLGRCEGSNSCVSITSPDIQIDDIKFNVKNSNLVNGQASVYIIIKGSVYVSGKPISFAIQTLASERNFQ